MYHTCEKQKHETMFFLPDSECIILQIFISSSPEASELSDSEPLASSSGKASAIPCFQEAAAALGGACKYWTDTYLDIEVLDTYITYFFELLTYL